MDKLQTLLEEHAELSSADYKAAQEAAKKEGTSLMLALENLNVVPSEKIVKAFAKHFNISHVDLGTKVLDKAITGLLPGEIAKKFFVIPVEKVGNNLIVATSDPNNLKALDAIRVKSGFVAKPLISSELRIREALDRYYGSVDISGLSGSKAPKQKKDSKVMRQTISSGKGEDGPIVKLVNDILIQCKEKGASDIHIEPYEEYMRIRLRIDGALVEIAKPPIGMKAPLISRVKIMSSLNIAESRLPQDGAININIGDKPVDFRVSTLPTVYGEKIVMRILDKSSLQVDMTQLGFEVDQLEGFKESISTPNGIVLVTGPTGSGKTTTLYSALQDLNKEESNIMTSEDPVEYNLAGINQVQMKPDIGLNFAAALRSFLRQDPDIIMVGEIRDLETAEIAMKASLTGHLVLSTLHTNSAPDTIARLLNMGVAPFNLVAALNCITAQRLMKKICEACKEEDKDADPKVLIEIGVPASHAEKVKAYKGKGCMHCGGSGSKGRIAVHEVLIMNDPVKRSILNGDAAIDIKRVAMKNGMRTLRQSAIKKMVKGIVPIQEVIRVTGQD